MQNFKDPRYDVAIIGAGISGLSARIYLAKQGLSVVTLEKSRGLGGRCATRRGPGWIADLGAQCFSVQSSRLKTLLEPFKEELSEVRLAPHPLSDPALVGYVHRSGMSGLTHLFKNLGCVSDPVCLEQKVNKLTLAQGMWQLDTEGGEHFSARALILAIPLPQAVGLLKTIPFQNTDFLAELVDHLSVLNYSSCLALGLKLKAKWQLSCPAIWQTPTDQLLGIYDQAGKGLLNSFPIWVVQTGSDFSRFLWKLDPIEAGKWILDEAFKILPAVKMGEVLFIHRWLYAKSIWPGQAFTQSCLNQEANLPLPLAIAGDGLGHSLVEEAFEWGHQAALRIASRLKVSSYEAI